MAAQVAPEAAAVAGAPDQAVRGAAGVAPLALRLTGVPSTDTEATAMVEVLSSWEATAMLMATAILMATTVIDRIDLAILPTRSV